jgi:hypothetical protein
VQKQIIFPQSYCIPTFSKQNSKNHNKYWHCGSLSKLSIASYVDKLYYGS